MTGMKNNKIIGIIPARWASTRFPGKPLAKIIDRPLLHWVVERVRQSSGLDDIIVATDDERIRKCAEEIGVRVAMTRTDHPTGTDRIAEAAAHCEADGIINIQGDEPLIDPELIDQLAETLRSSEAGWDMVTAAERIGDRAAIENPDIVKVVFGREGQALYFSRAPIPFRRDKADSAAVQYWRHIGIYGYTAEFLKRFVAAPPCALEEAEKLEQLRALDMGCRMKVVQTRRAGVGVDRPEDIEKVEALLQKESIL